MRIKEQETRLTLQEHDDDDNDEYGITRRATDDYTIRRMCFTCWITKTTDTHPEYVVFIAFQLQ